MDEWKNKQNNKNDLKAYQRNGICLVMSSRGQGFTIISNATESGRLCDSRCSVLYDTLCLFFSPSFTPFVMQCLLLISKRINHFKKWFMPCGRCPEPQISSLKQSPGIQSSKHSLFRAQRSAILFLGSHHLWMNNLSATEAWNTFCGTEMYLSFRILFRISN